jgi:GTP-binding protein YchF
MLRTGIVGLPNVGKSTLFNALTRTRKAEAANYPFCTIEPNVGVVQVPDARLEPLSQISKSEKIISAAIEFLDIAGLVEGASKGEGLGNQFLSNIREVEAIVEVIRCFEDDDIIHNMGSVDAVRDIEVIGTELVLADLQSVERQLERNQKKARGLDKEAIACVALLERLTPHLNEGKPANTFPVADDREQERINGFQLLSSKPVIYACNVAEDDVADPDANPHVAKVREFVRTHRNAECCVICSKLEEDLGELSDEEAMEFLHELGAKDSGVSDLIHATYHLLGLASYLTSSETETRAWTFIQGMKAPECAGVIHTDFERGFIKAEVVSWEDLKAAGSVAAARETGRYRMEGREYIVKDGDVIHFRFNV